MEQAETVARDAAKRAMEERGLDGIDDLLTTNKPAAILAWCRWWDAQRDVTKRLLAAKIRTGQMPPPQHRDTLANQRSYGDHIRAWLAKYLPDVCRQDERVVEWERRLYGDSAAVALECWREPHHAAVAAVLRLHRRDGRGIAGRDAAELYGAEIREAVRAADDRAVADYRAIAANRGLTFDDDGNGGKAEAVAA